MKCLSRRALTIGFVAASLSCEPQPRGPHGIDSIFLGFDFVGEFPPNDGLLASHKHESNRLPLIWLPGPQYVFHLNEDFDFEDIPARILPARLRSAGATVIGAPKNWSDMATPNAGNPIWVIDFTQPGIRGTIRNRYDRNRRDKFSDSAKLRSNIPNPRIDDYVLMFALK